MTLREFCGRTGKNEYLNYENPLFYIDIETFGSDRFTIKNVKNLSVDKMNFVIFLSDGSKKFYSFCSCKYVGFGFMEDLNCHIHLPETLFM